MTVAEAIQILSTFPSDLEICTREKHTVEWHHIKGFEIKNGYTRSSSPQWLYSSVEFPSDWTKTKIVKVVF